MIWVVILTVLIGANTVLCRYLNARFAKQNSLNMGTLMNYLTGLTTSLIALFIFGGSAAVIPVGTPTFRTVMMFLGGMVGVIMVEIFIYVTPRLPAFLGTILIFVSQLGVGLVLDFVVSGAFSPGKLIGGLMVLAGLAHYAWINARKAATERAAALE